MTQGVCLQKGCIGPHFGEDGAGGAAGTPLTIRPSARRNLPLVPVRIAFQHGVTHSDGRVRGRVRLGCAMPMIDVGIYPNYIAGSAASDLAQF